MVLTLETGTRRARKTYRCQMCSSVIAIGDLHEFQNNVYDARAYTWRQCLPCRRDGVIGFVADWCGGWDDEGVDYWRADEWAPDAALYASTTRERIAGRNWLARAGRSE